MVNNMKDKLRELLENMDDVSLIQAWNEYQCLIRGDDEIFPMDWFDEMMAGKEPWEIARCCYYSGKFCPAHDYFWFNGYGNVESSDFPLDNIYIDDMIDYIIEHQDNLGNQEIQDILDELQEDEQ